MARCPEGKLAGSSELSGLTFAAKANLSNFCGRSWKLLNCTKHQWQNPDTKHIPDGFSSLRFHGRYWWPQLMHASQHRSSLSCTLINHDVCSEDKARQIYSIPIYVGNECDSFPSRPFPSESMIIFESFRTYQESSERPMLPNYGSLAKGELLQRSVAAQRLLALNSNKDSIQQW